jgi:LNS2 (Lipin/Ned1/Smp2)
MDFYHVNAHEFKYETLQKYVIQPFVDLGINIDDFLYAGFGNTLYDMHAYHNAGIEPQRMFIIDKQSRIHCCDASSNLLSPKTEDVVAQLAQTQRAFGHPKKYELLRGTLFLGGYADPELITYISSLSFR